MSLTLSRDAWQVELPAVAKIVLLSLCDHANAEARCWPSVARLGERCGLHRTAVIRALAALARAGHITVEAGSGRLNHYKFHPKIGCGERPVAESDRSLLATTPVAQSDMNGRLKRPDQSLKATPIFQEPVINRSGSAPAREAVAESDRSLPATRSARAQAIIDRLASRCAMPARR
jgi:hypothetical protein